jgi:sugar phosphate isomerase/epimerase
MKKSCSGFGICSPDRFPYYLATWIFRKESADDGRAWEALADRALREGYRGLEIHDRRLLRVSDREAEKIIELLQKKGLEVVLGLDTDFTAPGAKARSKESQRTIRRLRWAGALGIGLVRLTTGGQKLSLARLIRTLQPAVPLVSRGVENFFTRPLVAQGFRKLKGTGNKPIPADGIQRVADGLRLVAAAAEETGLLLVIENHWGVSSDWRNLALLMKAVPSPALGICLDWGNFPARTDVLPGIQGLLPWTLHQHAKSYGFDSPEQISRLPYRDIVLEVEKAGYTGAVTVEYEGPGDPWAGCRQTMALIEKVYREASD